mgnify:CR=1 FL=1
MQEKIIILDFGSQYTQLIARRVRELNVYCEIHPFNRIPAIDSSVRGVILSGSPFSVRDAQAPTPDLSAIRGRLPLLGVCYGAQYLAHAFGGEVQPAPSREYGRAMLTVGDAQDPLMRDLPATTQVWMSHGDTITRVPEGYGIVASTEDVRVAAYRIGGERTWGIQFHPEVYHSTDGKQLLKNFVVGICGCAQSWTSESFVESTVRELREKLGDDRVVLGLSGGVDSAALYPPKRFLGAARNIENGGSLTILASALIDTGSKMDEVIFEEFKGTGNMELKLDRDLADRRIFPAIDPVASGTRNEDLLVDEQMRPFVFGLRRILAGMNNTERAAASFIKGLKGTNTNQEFLVRSAKKHSDYEQTF